VQADLPEGQHCKPPGYFTSRNNLPSLSTLSTKVVSYTNLDKPRLNKKRKKEEKKKKKKERGKKPTCHQPKPKAQSSLRLWHTASFMISCSRYLTSCSYPPHRRDGH